MPTSFSSDELYRASGGAVFDRGCQYAEDDRVGRLSRQGQYVTATVEGQRLYHVRLDLEDLTRSTCTCPYDGLCKHVVAAGLVWLDEIAESEGTPHAEGQTGMLASRLERVPAEELRAFLIRLATENDRVYTELDRWLFGRMLQEEPEGDVEGRLDALDAYLEEIFDAERISELAEDVVEEWSEEGQAAMGALVDLDNALDSVVRDLAKLPDSEPFAALGLQMLCERLAKADDEFEEVAGTWNRSASRAAEEFARRLKTMAADERLHWVHALMPTFADGARFLEPIMRAGEPDELPGIARELAALGGWHARRIAVGMLLDAGLDVEAVTTVSAAVEPDVELWLMLARHLRGRAFEEGRDLRGVFAEAAEGSLSCFREANRVAPRWQRASILDEIADLQRIVGRRREAMESRVESFRCGPTLERWKTAMAAATEASQGPAVKEELLTWLRESEPGTPLLCLVLASEGVDDTSYLAEAVLLARRLKSPDLHVAVADECKATSSEAARDSVGDLLVEAAEHLALRGGDDAYDQAASAARRLKELDPRKFARWYPTYRERHRRRRNLTRALAQVGL